MSEKFQRILDDIEKSEKKVEILPSDDVIREELRKIYDINPESLLGILLDNTGGIIIDYWIRIYGTGELNFITRNTLFPFDEIVIAEDVLGGLFLYLSDDKIGYFAPDTLELEELGIGMSQFMYWCLHGDTETFYDDYRWNNWREELTDISCNVGVSFYPFLWAETEKLESRSRRIVPMEEIIGLEFDMLKQLTDKAD
ncbi:MAG: DUF2625 family protein [Lachnospiraceae bacterium]|nr:DUF2625 family protein [Lachnospiraceae bacterium]